MSIFNDIITRAAYLVFRKFYLVISRAEMDHHIFSYTALTFLEDWLIFGVEIRVYVISRRADFLTKIELPCLDSCSTLVQLGHYYSDS